MLGILLTTLATALSLLVVDLVVPGVDIASFPSALTAAVAIGFVNAFIKPALSLLALPINFLTLGLFALVVNGVCFWIASLFVVGFSVNGLTGIILGPVVLALVSTFLNKYLNERGFGKPVSGSEATPAIGAEK